MKNGRVVFWETCVFNYLFESIMVFKPQECGISYLTVKGENIIILMHSVLSPFSLPRLPIYSLHVSNI